MDEIMRGILHSENKSATIGTTNVRLLRTHEIMEENDYGTSI